jgi:hypothetical protein
MMLELADDDRIAPAAPMAPKRNISRLFKVTLVPPEIELGVYHSMG